MSYSWIVLLAMNMAFVQHTSSQIVNSFIGMYLHGGSLQVGVNTQSSCLRACVTSTSCGAVDFNNRELSCWFHGSDTACGTLHRHQAISHYKFLMCTPDGQVRLGQVVSTHSGFHGFGGDLQPYVSSQDFCAAGCSVDESCQAMDFNSADNTCWFHNVTSACSKLYPKPGCTHLKLLTCSSFTSAPVKASDNVIVSTHSGFHANGGRPQSGLETEDLCIEACSANSACQAVDFNSNAKSCWFHGSMSACSTLYPKSVCTHSKLTSCTASNIALTNNIDSTNQQQISTTTKTNDVNVLVHLRGGRRQAGISDIAACAAACTGTCIALDFNAADKSCWFHSRATACGAFSFLPQSTHISETSCPSRRLQHGVPALPPRIHNNRIVGGQEALQHSWPWMVGLLIAVGGSNVPRCGGSLIADQWVITAAHCIFGSLLSNTEIWRVRLGDHDLTKRESSQVDHSVSQIIPHPKFMTNGFDYDVALLKLSNPVQPTNDISPVCLPGHGITFPDYKECVVTGWGATLENGGLSTTLQQVILPIVPQSLCRYYYSNTRIKRRMMCAGLAQGSRDACQGDSGGPLVCRQGSVWYQAGIVSFGIGCGRPSRPGVYTRLTEFVPWIQETIENNS